MFVRPALVNNATFAVKLIDRCMLVKTLIESPDFCQEDNLARPSTRLSAERLQELARMGATTMLNQLRTEIASIVRMFPQLEGGSVVGLPVPVETVKPRRRRMSAAGRRAIAAAQRARWAAVRKAAKPGRRKRKGMSAAARKAASERMKKYWAGKRKAKGK
jgi:hypothetical protein